MSETYFHFDLQIADEHVKAKKLPVAADFALWLSAVMPAMSEANNDNANNDDANNEAADSVFENNFSQKLPAELTIRVVGCEEMTKLNMEYRGKSGATNVLSFPTDYTNSLLAGLPPEALAELGLSSDLSNDELANLNAYIGDMVICTDVVEREAAEQNKTQLHHWAHLTIHGALHLLGYDHINAEDAEVMESIEVSALAALGIANPYA